MAHSTDGRNCSKIAPSVFSTIAISVSMNNKRGRLDRFLSRTLSISRNNLRPLLAAGRVRVNGDVINDPAFQIDEFSRIVVDADTRGETVLQQNTPLYLMLNKPVGVVSATRDDVHKTVLDLIDHPRKDELHIVGRLDRNTSGLLLLTNDSRWSEKIMAPEAKVEKVYSVELENDLSDEYVSAFAKGMYFPYENITTQPAVLEITGPKSARVVLKEGKYHQIKRMFGRFRNAVVRLHREKVGELELLDQTGQYLPRSHSCLIEPDSIWHQR